MKHNLKNRPKKADHYVEEYWRLAEQWFEGFEKELRARRKHMKAGKSMALYLFIKEILGENQA